MKKAYIICLGILTSSLSVASAQSTAPRTAEYSLNNTGASTNASSKNWTILTPSKTDALTLQDHTIGPQPASSQWNVQQFSAEIPLSFTKKENGFLIEPRFSKTESADDRFSQYYAEIKIGSVKFERGSNKPSGWYIFAATDGEALSINANDLSFNPDNVTVQLDDQITIGDLQAGVSTYIGDNTQLTFSYMEAEASYSSIAISNSEKEAFAGISLAKKF